MYRTDIPAIAAARRRRHGGFTLLEALVALLVLSIGLLGVAGLQLTGVRANQSSAWRSQATYLSGDVLERMRLNSINRAAYVVGFSSAAEEAEVEAEAEAEAAALDPTAANDIAAWKANLAAALPGGDGRIELDAGDDRMVTVTVQWNDARGDSAGDPAAEVAALQFTTRSRL